MIWAINNNATEIMIFLFFFLHYTDYTKSKYTQHTQAFLGSAKI